MAPTELLLARHGESEWNASGRWQGQADAPLNDVGRGQARALAERLAGNGIEVILSSDLARAAETAAIIGARLGLGVTPHAELREVDVGSWSGLTREEVADRFPDGYARHEAGETGHDGETHEVLTGRITAALLHHAALHPGKRVLVVTHGAVMRSAWRAATGEPSPSIGNCETIALKVVDGVLTRGLT